MVYSANGIHRSQALAAQMILAAQLSYKLKWESSEMCGFVWVRMSLAIVRSNSLLPCSPQDKVMRIRQQTELMDGAVMALLALWTGSIEGRHLGTTG